MAEYFFDLDLRSCLRVNASSEEEARRMIEQTIDCIDVDLGRWPNGDRILTEVSLKDPATIVLAEIDGKPVPPAGAAQG